MTKLRQKSELTDVNTQINTVQSQRMKTSLQHEIPERRRQHSVKYKSKQQLTEAFAEISSFKPSNLSKFITFYELCAKSQRGNC